MAKGGRIPTPPAQQWRRFRYRYMPIATFLLLGVVVLMLWQQHTGGPAITGEFYALSRDARSLVDGQLVALESGLQLEVGDSVEQGDVVARLDDQPIALELAAVNARIEELRKQIDAEIETQRLAVLDRNINLNDTQIRVAAEKLQLEERIEDLQRQMEDHRIVVTFTKIILTLEDDHLKPFQELLKTNKVTKTEVFEMQIERERVRQQLSQSEAAITKLNEQLQLARGRLANLDFQSPDIQADIGKLTAPLHAAIDTQLAALNQARWKLEALDIKAPISGVVRTIYFTPGQPVLAGEPVVTIASPENRTVIAYLREEQRVDIKEGSRVAVRLRTRPPVEYEGIVKRIGPHEEPVPVHQTPQRDPNILAWGVPIRIELTDSVIPAGVPGSLVDVWPKPASE